MRTDVDEPGLGALVFSERVQEVGNPQLQHVDRQRSRGLGQMAQLPEEAMVVADELREGTECDPAARLDTLLHTAFLHREVLLEHRAQVEHLAAHDRPHARLRQRVVRRRRDEMESVDVYGEIVVEAGKFVRAHRHHHHQ